MGPGRTNMGNMQLMGTNMQAGSGTTNMQANTPGVPQNSQSVPALMGNIHTGLGSAGHMPSVLEPGAAGNINYMQTGREAQVRIPLEF